MRVATLAYPEFRRDMARALRLARKAARRDHLVGVLTQVRVLREAGYLKKRHVRNVFAPWNEYKFPRTTEQVAA